MDIFFSPTVDKAIQMRKELREQGVFSYINIIDKAAGEGESEVIIYRCAIPMPNKKNKNGRNSLTKYNKI